MSTNKFVIIYDTYCGWCYGAGPIFDALVDSDAEIEVLHRNLFCGNNAYRMADGKGEHILEADRRIAKLTGQKFSQRYTDNLVRSKTEVLDSSFTAQAAALIHSSGVEKEFAVRQRLETARYVDGVSASDRKSVVNALLAEGVERDIAELIGTKEAQAMADKIAAHADQFMTRANSYGVPTILELRGSDLKLVDHAKYYQAPERIVELLA